MKIKKCLFSTEVEFTALDLFELEQKAINSGSYGEALNNLNNRLIEFLTDLCDTNKNR